MTNQSAKILVLDHRAGTGGGQRVMRDYLLRSELREHITTMFFEDGPLVGELREHGLRVRVLGGSSDFVDVSRKSSTITDLVTGFFRFTHVAYAVLKEVRVSKYDVIVCNSTKSALVGGIIGTLLRKKVVVRLHGILNKDIFNTHTLLIVQFTFKYLVTEILAVSQAVKDSLVVYGVNENKIHVVYNGIEVPKNLSEYPIQKIVSKTEGSIVIGLVGRLVDWKGQALAITAIKNVISSYPTVRLLLVGDASYEDDSYEARLHQMVDTMQLEDNVIFTGFIEEIYGFITAVDLMLHTSTKPDPLPTVVLESIALGTYIIAAKTGGVPEMINDDAWGTMFEPNNAHALSNAIVSAIKQDKLGNKGTNKVFINKFSMNAYVKNMDHALIS